MTEKGFITANSGDTEVAGTLSIAAPRALYAVASGHKPKKNPEELLPASPADRGSGIRLIKSEDRKKDDITNRPARSTYPKKKSVLTSGATPAYLWHGSPHRALRTLDELTWDIGTESPRASELQEKLEEFMNYITSNAAPIPNYADRHRHGEPIA